MINEIRAQEIANETLPSHADRLVKVDGGWIAWTEGCSVAGAIGISETTGGIRAFPVTDLPEDLVGITLSH